MVNVGVRERVLDESWLGDGLLLMADACCAPRTEPPRTPGTGSHRISADWRTAAACAAALFLAIGVAADLANRSAAATAAFIMAVIAGGATFGPSSLSALRRGRLGVGPDLIGHARPMRSVVLQNLALSGLIFAVLIPVATRRWLGLGAVVAMTR